MTAREVLGSPGSEALRVAVETPAVPQASSSGLASEVEMEASHSDLAEEMEACRSREFQHLENLVEEETAVEMEDCLGPVAGKVGCPAQEEAYRSAEEKVEGMGGSLAQVDGKAGCLAQVEEKEA